MVIQKPMRTQSTCRIKLLEVQEKSEQRTIGFSFASDWSRGWREFSKPIREHSTIVDCFQQLLENLSVTKKGITFICL